MYIATAFARQILRYFHRGGVSGAFAPSAKTRSAQFKRRRIGSKYGEFTRNTARGEPKSLKKLDILS